jgi:CBS domain-containing protein
MSYLLSLAQQPPVIVEPGASVLDAVKKMSENKVGAVGVVEKQQLVGVFTERDLMERVVVRQLDPATTLIQAVMTSPVQSADADASPDDALRRMVELHIRHLPITDASHQILGMLSIRNLLQNQLDKTRDSADALEAFLTADGPGG